MPALFDRIKACVTAERYLVSEHAIERLDERQILEWQVIDGVASARLLSERPNDRPHPSIEVLQILADGTEVKVVWSWIKSIDAAKLVTVHLMDALP